MNRQAWEAENSAARAKLDEEGRAGGLSATPREAEIALARCLIHSPDAWPAAEPCLRLVPSADPELQPIYDLLTHNARKGEVLGKEALRMRLRGRVSTLVLDPLFDTSLVDDIGLVPGLALTVARRRAENTIRNSTTSEEMGAAIDALGRLNVWEHEIPADDGHFFYRHGDTNLPLVPPQLVRDLLPRQGLGIVAAQFGRGKSLLATHLTAAIITGRPFMGRETLATGGVIWNAAEGIETVAGRFAAALLETGVQSEEPLPLSFTDRFPLLSGAQALPIWIKRIGDERARMKQVFQVDLRLIVIDHYSAAVSPTDADKTAEAETMMYRLRTLAKTFDCFVLFIDHFGKDVSTGVRNSSVKEASSDATLVLLGDSGPGSAIDGPRIELRKYRHGKQGYTVPYSIESVSLPDKTEAPVIRLELTKATDSPPGASTSRAAKESQNTDRLILTLQAMEHGEHSVEVEDLAIGFGSRKIEEHAVREVWLETYPADNEDQKKRRATALKAFNRALQDAVKRNLIQVNHGPEENWIWFTELGRGQA